MINKKLKEYSKQGDTKKFTDTYNELKSFFESKIDKEKYGLDIYLQGSYGNNTNIEDESDVDIVIEMNKVYYYNIDSLTRLNKKNSIQNILHLIFQFMTLKNMY